jgi:hypothetical protein
MELLGLCQILSTVEPKSPEPSSRRQNSDENATTSVATQSLACVLRHLLTAEHADSPITAPAVVAVCAPSASPRATRPSSITWFPRTSCEGHAPRARYRRRGSGPGLPESLSEFRPIEKCRDRQESNPDREAGPSRDGRELVGKQEHAPHH